MSYKLTQRIKERRRQLDISQEQLALLLGTTQNQVWRYESGKNDPTGDVLVRIAQALETSVDYLLGLTETPGDSRLSDYEREALELLRAKTEDQQRRAVEILRML